MVRTLAKYLTLFVLAAGGGFAVWFYNDRFSTAHAVAKLEAEKAILQQVVQRLSDEKRVAEVLVTGRSRAKTDLLFVEYDKAGQSLPPRNFSVNGDQVHVDAMVIKFDRGFVKDGDALRGRSIALFTTIYGDRDTPASGQRVDRPGETPAVFRDSMNVDPNVQKFETELWGQFWRLTTDAGFRTEKGVRVATGQGVWGPLSEDRLYTITLEADGGLNLTSEPLRGIYREALKEKGARGTAE